jgi:hypothetical protein
VIEADVTSTAAMTPVLDAGEAGLHEVAGASSCNPVPA